MLHGVVGNGVVTPTGSYDDLVLAKSPFGYWKLDETSGSTAFDSSGNGNDLTYNGSVALNQTGPATGVPAVRFDPTSEDVTGTLTAAIPTGEPITLELWLRMDAVGTQPPVISLVGVGDSDHYVMAVRPALNRLVLESRNGASDLIIADGFSTGLVWVHLVGVYASTTDRTLYFNGAVAGTDTSTAPTPDGTLDRIGINTLARNSPVAGGSGSYARVAMYPGALSAAQVAQHYTRGLLPA